MKKSPGLIIGWICAGLVTVGTLISAVFEFMPMTDPAIIDFNQRAGITDIVIQLGIVKLIIAILFVIPRTSTVGFVLMVGYYGGALATNITHGFTPAEYSPIIVILALLTVSAYFRNPELLSRLLKKPVSTL